MNLYHRTLKEQDELKDNLYHREISDDEDDSDEDVDSEDKKDKKKEKKQVNERINPLKLLNRGSVTEITMDGKTFQVYDAKKIHNIINFVERHEDRLFELNQANIKLNQQVVALTQTVQKLQNTVNKLQDQIKNDRFGSNNYL